MRIQASCGDAVRPHQVACATRQVMNVVENKNETTLEPTTMNRSQIQEFRKNRKVACNQDSVGCLLIVCGAVPLCDALSALNFHLEQMAGDKKLDELRSFQECWD